jgi:hypothetical protein
MRGRSSIAPNTGAAHLQRKHKKRTGFGSHPGRRKRQASGGSGRDAAATTGVLKLVAIGILFFAAVGAAGQTTTPDSNCSINSTGANTASADCTSTTYTPPQPVPLDQDPSYKAGQQLGKGIGNLGTALIVNHKRAKMIKEYCATHPGEDYGQKDANGTFTKLGTCPGSIPVARRQQILIEVVKADSAKSGVAKFAEIKATPMSYIQSARAPYASIL